MPLVTIKPISMSNGDLVTEFVDAVGTSETEYSFPSEQNHLMVKNNGNAPITLKLNGLSRTLNPSEEWSGKTSFTSVFLTSANQTQQVNVRSIRGFMQGDAALSALYLAKKPKTTGNVLDFMGDSITDQNIYASCRGFVSWATALTSHQIKMGNKFSTGGYTSQKIKDEHLPNLLSQSVLPNYCTVLAGTNDVGSVPATPLSETIANLTFMYDSLLDAGVTPVLCTIPPRKDNAGILANVYRLNNWVRQTAMKRGLPLVDFHRVLSDTTGGYSSPSYAADAIHPSKLGAKVMGTELARVMSKIVPFYNVNLVTFENDGNVIPNALNLTDTNSDGIPDNWSKVAGTGTFTSALTDPVNSDIVGKWFTITKTDAPYAIFRNTGRAVTPGHRYALAFRMKVSGVDAATMINLNVIKAPNANSVILSRVFSEWSLETEACTIYREFTVPLDVTQAQFDLSITGAAVFSSGQYTLINLTELNL